MTVSKLRSYFLLACQLVDKTISVKQTESVNADEYGQKCQVLHITWTQQSAYSIPAPGIMTESRVTFPRVDFVA